ncbi:hypothetical protein [Williamsia sp. D3]|uniref:hypothetical protein n=1 Tax=Williamsia sp. D3 TaxID=1313067 RepID=UPI0003D2A007|nr:hypothetical protein [Williamsia sp. D3]ETD34367.1 hypothetical protein W823_04090 [Williamsia sp. D3]
MEVSTLHSVTEDLAGYLSEVTQGDLRSPTHLAGCDIGDLYVDLLNRNIRAAAAIAPESSRQSRTRLVDRSALASVVNLYGGGFDTRYRQTARAIEIALAALETSAAGSRINGVQVDLGAICATLISDIVVDTWYLAEAMGLSYRPNPAVVMDVFNGLKTPPLDEDEDAEAIWACVRILHGSRKGRTEYRPAVIEPSRS